MLWLKRLATTETAFYFVDENGQWQEQLKNHKQLFRQNHVCRTTANGCQTNRSDLVSTMAPAGKTVSEVLLETLNATELNETTASLAVHQTMKENGQLFVSNSMAIRYLDRFMDSRPYRMFEIAASTGLMGLFQLL